MRRELIVSFFAVVLLIGISSAAWPITGNVVETEVRPTDDSSDKCNHFGDDVGYDTFSAGGYAKKRVIGWAVKGESQSVERYCDGSRLVSQGVSAKTMKKQGYSWVDQKVEVIYGKNSQKSKEVKSGYWEKTDDSGEIEKGDLTVIVKDKEGNLMQGVSVDYNVRRSHQWITTTTTNIDTKITNSAGEVVFEKYPTTFQDPKLGMFKTREHIFVAKLDGYEKKVSRTGVKKAKEVIVKMNKVFEGSKKNEFYVLVNDENGNDLEDVEVKFYSKSCVKDKICSSGHRLIDSKMTNSEGMVTFQKQNINPYSSIGKKISYEYWFRLVAEIGEDKGKIGRGGRPSREKTYVIFLGTDDENETLIEEIEEDSFDEEIEEEWEENETGEELVGDEYFEEETDGIEELVMDEELVERLDSVEDKFDLLIQFFCESYPNLSSCEGL